MHNQARLVDESFATPTQSDQDASAEAVRAQLFEFYATSRWVAPVGNLVGCVLFAVIASPLLPGALLLVWLGAGVTISALLWASVTVPYFSQHLDKSGLPVMCPLAHSLVGALWGVAVWLGPAEPHTEYLLLCLALLFAISAGTLTGASGLTRLTMSVLAPMWLLGSIGF